MLTCLCIGIYIEIHRIKSKANLLNNQFLPNMVPTKYDKSTINKSILYKQFFSPYHTL